VARALTADGMSRSGALLRLLLLWLAGADFRLTLLAAPPVLPLIHRDLSFLIWAIPAAATATLVAVLTPQVPRELVRKSALWWPNWRDTRMWKLGLMQGSNGPIFFGADTSRIPCRPNRRPRISVRCATLQDAESRPT
jgi:hypothetical protein